MVFVDDVTVLQEILGQNLCISSSAGGGHGHDAQS